MRFTLYSALLAIVLVISSCANRGVGPQGGPKDSVPPQIVKEKPLNGTLNYQGDRVEVTFDEYIQLQDIASNVIISPPQLHAPQIQAFGKKLLVTFQDTLIPNSTYTIDFGSAIVDNNERIPRAGYTFAFSTGDHIDTLGVFGQIIDARTLNPISGVTVGLQDSLPNEAFEIKAFTRIGRTDSMGYFSIKNIRPGQYRVYGLWDNSRDYRYQPGEGLAYTEDIFEPYIRVETLGDSLGTETAYLEPSNIVLWFFEEEKKPQYFLRATHEQKHLLTLTFASPADSLPQIRALRPTEADTAALSDGQFVNWLDYALVQPSIHNDTINYWIKDSAAMLDTLYFELTYLKTDSLYNYYSFTDTIKAVYHAPRVNARTQAKLDKQRREQKISIKTNAKSAFEVYDTLQFTVDAPLMRLIPDSIHLQVKLDSTYEQIPFTILSKDSAHMTYQILAHLEPTKDYQLLIDSAAMEDIFLHVNNATKASLHLKSNEDYATLRIRVPGAPNNLRMQLLSKDDKVLKDQGLTPNGFFFRYIAAGQYYLRVYEDLDNNNQWTTGDWQRQRQPEPVYYFPSRLQLRANWDFEEIFDYKAVPQLESKPFEIIRDGAEYYKKKK